MEAIDVDEEELTKDWNLTLHDAVCSIFDKFHDADKNTAVAKIQKTSNRKTKKNTLKK